VTGEDALKLLQGVVTNDVERLATEPAVFSGLLSPQGKVLFDFFVVRLGGAADADVLLDVAADRADDLVKRLSMYRLRAKATIERRPSVMVEARWDGDASLAAGNDVLAVISDPRHAGMGSRVYLAGSLQSSSDPAAYHAHRIALGVPEGGKDYDFGDAFPHEAGFDLLNGVSFEKGCYVGQEIVSRMEHRGTVRKRVVRVSGASQLPADRPDVLMGDVVIGRLGSVFGREGLALLRLDRAIEAIDKRIPITAAGIALDIDAAMIARQRQLMAEKAGGAP
jgi:folate-binding protein YgfZ